MNRPGKLSPSGNRLLWPDRQTSVEQPDRRQRPRLEFAELLDGAEQDMEVVLFGRLDDVALGLADEVALVPCQSLLEHG